MARRPERISLDELPPCSGWSRRDFCAVAGTGLITLGLGACDPGQGRLTLGNIDDPPPGSRGIVPGGDGGALPDLANQGSSPDLAGSGGSCASGLVACGSAAAIGVGSAQHFTDNVSYDFYLCRDSSGLFTVDAQCTHAGCDVKLSGGNWFCPCHAATFRFDGTGPTIPAGRPLNNYAVCVDSSGNAFVDINTVVSNTTRA